MQKKVVLAVVLALMTLLCAVSVAFAQEETPPEMPYETIHAVWALPKPPQSPW